MKQVQSNRPLKVLVFTTQGPASTSGVRVYCEALASALSALGWVVQLDTPASATRWLLFVRRVVLKLVRWTPVRGLDLTVDRFFCYLSSINYLQKRRNEIDVVLAQDLYPGAAAVRLGFETWTTCHFSDPIVEVLRSNPTTRFSAYVFSKFLRNMIASQHRYVCLSRSQAGNMRAYAPNADITVLPTICRVKSDANRIVHQKFRIVMIGRMEWLKGQDRLIRAMAYLKDIDVEAWLVGDGDQRGEWERLADDLGVRGRTYFCGYQKNPESILRMCDLYVHTSKMEAMPLTPIEAAACGIEVWSFETPGYNDWGLFDGTPKLLQTTKPEQLALMIRNRVVQGASPEVLAHQQKVVLLFDPSNSASAYARMIRKAIFVDDGLMDVSGHRRNGL